MSRKETFISWAGQIVAAAILAMAMVPKFMSAQESIDLFTTLGVEPWGRYMVGLIELVAVLLLLVPQLRMHVVGGLVAAGLMAGALASHAWRLGFSGDMGTAAGMAVVVLLASLVVLYLRREELLKAAGLAP
jgi:hypothetical protein